nr:MAG TPA: hypothetical protein [Caudoviricetes sp.]
MHTQSQEWESNDHNVMLAIFTDTLTSHFSQISGSPF